MHRRVELIEDLLSAHSLGRPVVQISYGPMSPVVAMPDRYRIQHFDFVVPATFRRRSCGSTARRTDGATSGVRHLSHPSAGQNRSRRLRATMGSVRTRRRTHARHGETAMGPFARTHRPVARRRRSKPARFLADAAGIPVETTRRWARTIVPRPGFLPRRRSRRRPISSLPDPRELSRAGSVPSTPRRESQGPSSRPSTGTIRPYPSPSSAMAGVGTLLKCRIDGHGDRPQRRLTAGRRQSLRLPSCDRRRHMRLDADGVLAGGDLDMSTSARDRLIVGLDLPTVTEARENRLDARRGSPLL